MTGPERPTEPIVHTTEEMTMTSPIHTLERPGAAAPKTADRRLPKLLIALLALGSLAAVAASSALAAAPTGDTQPASGITHHGATLHGTFNANGSTVTDCHFNWGTTISYGQTVSCGSGQGGTSNHSAFEALRGLSPRTTYHFQLVVTNADGTLTGSDLTFDTLGTPEVTTDPATNVTETSATFNGLVNPSGGPVSDCHFDYGPTSSYGQSVPCAESVGSGTDLVDVHADVSGLDFKTPYHFRLVVTNDQATVNGADRYMFCACYFGIASVSASLSTTQAGAHPDVTTSFDLTRDPNTGDTWTDIKDAIVDLPPGLAGNPELFPKCPVVTFIASAVPGSATECPTDSQVGVANVTIGIFGTALTFPEPIYVLPGNDQIPARLAFVAVFDPVLLNVEVRPDDYGLTVAARDTLAFTVVNAVETTTWGVPPDPSHDSLRFGPQDVLNCFGPCGPSSSGLAPVPFMTNPTSCQPGQTIDFDLTAYLQPGQHSTASAPLPDITGCQSVPFGPVADFAPTTTEAGSSSGMDVSITQDQDGMLHPNTLAPAHLKRVFVTLPEGLVLNAGAADGLQACTTAQIGMVSRSPITFDNVEPRCPAGSKVGVGEVVSPVLGEVLRASLYLADPDDNPFDALLSGYLVVRGSGVLLKIPGRFETDPNTGRLTAIFDNNPQQPVGRVDLHFKGGNRGVITTPPTCGDHTSSYEMTGWSDRVVDGTSQFTINQNCGAAGAFNPGFRAGSASPLAGAFSTFVMQVTRDSGTPQLTGVAVDPPRGITGKLAGVPYCSDAALAAVSGALGAGAGELASPSCPAASRIGTVVAGAGSGNPFYVDTGKVYLAGPYKGAPVSLGIVAPAVAGPFDLGNVMVRTALHIDPRTAQLHAISDPLPTILHGIQLDLRDVRVLIDKQDFAINPTDCSAKASNGAISGQGGASAAVSDRFQVGECAALGFKPKIGLRLKGGTRRGAHPALTAVLRTRPGDANISRVSVSFPRSEFLENAHIRTVCTRAAFAADSCPRGAIYGRAAVKTPLLDYVLRGPAYLRSSDNLLPDLVPDLRGPAHQPIRVESAGRTDSAKGGIRNTFDFVPDAPFTKLVLRMQGGKKGLLVNSRDICARTYRAVVKFRAHNNRTYTARPKVRAQCGKRKGKRGGHHRASLRLKRAVG